MQAIVRFLATGAYTGFAPFAPGTFGTLPAVALAPLVAGAADFGVVPYLLLLVAIIAVAIWAADRFAAETGLKDPGSVVIDEIAGYLVTVAFLPVTPLTLIAGFFVFRFFDIVKPPPARRFEMLPGGVGIVMDDVMAGIYGNLLLRLVLPLL